MVSIILPTYNRAALLPRAIRSVLAQTDPDLELIVVDDASTDDTAGVVAAIRDSRLRYERLPANSGVSAARNRGIALARGAFIAFQDSDDVWYPLMLERQLAFLHAQQTDAVFCRFRRCTPEGEAWQIFPRDEVPAGPIRLDDLLFENLCSTQCLLARAELLRGEGFDPRLPALVDWALILRLCRRGRVCYQPEILVDLYMQPDSLSRSGPKLLAARRRLVRQYRRRIVPAERLTLQWLWSIKHYALPLGEPFWRECLVLLSTRHSLELNKRLLLEAWADLRGQPWEENR